MDYEELPTELKALIPKSRMLAARKSKDGKSIFVCSPVGKGSEWDRFDFDGQKWIFFNPKGKK